MSKRIRSAKLFLTDRALADIKSIEEYSVATWGKRTATKYIGDIQAALDRLVENPGLLRAEPDFHPSLRFYSVNKHVITCEVLEGTIFVLTLLHGSLDIPTRLGELAPTLVQEAEMLHRKLAQSQKRRKKRSN